MPPGSRPWYISTTRSAVPSGPVDRQAVRQRAAGAVAPGDVEPAQVDAVVGVQVGEHRRRRGRRATGTAAAAPSAPLPRSSRRFQVRPVGVVLHEVGRRGRLRAGERPGAADDGDPHRQRRRDGLRGAVNTGPSLEPTPRKRRASAAELLGVAGGGEAVVGRREVVGAQQVGVGEHPVDVLGGLLGRGDQRDAVAHDVGDDGGEQRVVRAAEHQGVDAALAQRVEVLVGDPDAARARR